MKTIKVAITPFALFAILFLFEINTFSIPDTDTQFLILPKSSSSKTYRSDASIGDKNYTPFGVELRNKTGSTIWATVVNKKNHDYRPDSKDNDDFYSKAHDVAVYEIPQGSNGDFALDMRYITGVALWTENPGDMVQLRRDYNYDASTWKFEPQPDLTLETTEKSIGKTLYLTIDTLSKTSGVRQQTGTLGGLSGKTETGFNLKENIKDTKELIIKVKQ